MRESVDFITIPSEGFVIPPVGMGYLSGALKEGGYSSRVLNAFELLHQTKYYTTNNSGNSYSRIIESREDFLLRDLLTWPPFLSYDPKRITTHHQGFDFSEYLDIGLNDIARIRQGWLNLVGIGCEEEFTDTESLLPQFKSLFQRVSSTGIVGFGVRANLSIPTVILSYLLKREFPELTIIWGGPHMRFASIRDYFLSRGLVDVVVEGEADWIITKIADRIFDDGVRECGTIPGVSVLSGDTMQSTPPDCPAHTNDAWTKLLDALPLPNYSGFLQKSQLNLLPLHLSRGCLFRCAFCSGVTLHPARYRTFSAARVIHELDHLRSKWPKLEIAYFTDPAINNDPGLLQELCELWTKKFTEEGYEQSPLKIRAYANAVDTHWPADLFAWLERAGFQHFSIGVETLYPSHQQKYLPNKRYTISDLEKLFKKIISHGIDVNPSFIIGWPDDTPESIIQQFQMIIEVAKLTGKRPRIYPFRADRGSTLELHPERYGIKKAQEDYSLLSYHTFLAWHRDSDDSQYYHIDEEFPEYHLATRTIPHPEKELIRRMLKQFYELQNPTNLV